MLMVKQKAAEATEGNGFAVFSMSFCLDAAWTYGYEVGVRRGPTVGGPVDLRPLRVGS